MDDLGNMALAFVGIIFVLLLTYYATRFMARHYHNFNNNRNLKLLERITLGKDRFIAVIEVKGKMMLVGISEHSITLLADLPELSIDDFKQEQSPDFAKILMENIKTKMGLSKDKYKGGKLR